MISATMFENGKIKSGSELLGFYDFDAGVLMYRGAEISCSEAQAIELVSDNENDIKLGRG